MLSSHYSESSQHADKPRSPLHRGCLIAAHSSREDATAADRPDAAHPAQWRARWFCDTTWIWHLKITVLRILIFSLIHAALAISPLDADAQLELESNSGSVASSTSSPSSATSATQSSQALPATSTSVQLNQQPCAQLLAVTL